jgi:hypothetical protein
MKKKLLRILPLAAVALATLLALFYAWTDWAGARRWKSVEAALRAKGEPLTIAEIEPSPIPDEINFAAAPVFVEASQPANWQQSRLAKIPSFTGSVRPNSTDLANAARSVDPKFTGSDAEAARLILAEASKSQPVFDEVRKATKLPGTDWKVDLSKGFQAQIPQIQPLLRLSQFLSTQAKARLELGDSAGALADILLTIDLAGRIAPPRFLITYLVGQVMLGNALSALKFGIARHAWTSQELESIQHALASLSMPQGLASALRWERVLFNETLLKAGGSDIEMAFQFSESNGAPSWVKPTVSLLWNVRPSGWNNEDRCAYSTALQHMIEQLESPATYAATRSETVTTPPPNPWQISLLFLRTPLTRLTLPSVENLPRRAMFAQAQIDAARTACAIERYRLAHGALPPTLDALCPEFLSKPTPDLMTGEPLRYQPGSDDSYVLYSVGWNGVDDGGSDAGSTRKNSPTAADWVWKIDARS